MALLLVGPSRAQEKIGFVLEVKGAWSLDSSPASPLSRAAALPAGGVIRLRAPSGVGANYIVVADVNGGVLDRRECYGPENCQALVLPKAAARRSRIGSLVRGIGDLIFRNPIRYRAAISRGAGGEMQEAVVMLSAGSVDLGPAFAKMGAGKYLLRMKPLGEERQTALDPFEFDWNPAGAQPPIGIKGIGKGLYHLILLDAGDRQPLGGGMDAWVLICEPETYPNASSDFKEVSELTASWGSQVSKATARTFLRAFLEELAGRK